MIKEKTDNNGHAQDNINEHLKIDFDMFFDSKNFGGINKNIITSEINISPKDKIPWFFSATNINNFKELSNEEDIMNLHEIQLKNNISNNIQKCNDKQNINKSTNNNIIKNFKNEITEDKLKNLGFKSLLGGNIFMKNKNIIINNGFDLLNKKREGEKYIKKLYKNNINDFEEEKMIMDNGQYNGNIYKEQNQQKNIKGGGEFEQNKKSKLTPDIQNLINTKKQESITLNVFEKYKPYKKLNSNEYKKEKIIPIPRRYLE